jgi:hypothetical protein
MGARKVWSGRPGEHCEAAQLTVGSGPPVPGAFWPPAPVDMYVCIRIYFVPIRPCLTSFTFVFFRQSY